MKSAPILDRGGFPGLPIYPPNKFRSIFEKKRRILTNVIRRWVYSHTKW